MLCKIVAFCHPCILRLERSSDPKLAAGIGRCCHVKPVVLVAADSGVPSALDHNFGRLNSARIDRTYIQVVTMVAAFLRLFYLLTDVEIKISSFTVCVVET